MCREITRLKGFVDEIVKEGGKYIEALINIKNPIRPKRKQVIENPSNMKGSRITFLGGAPSPWCNYSKVGKSFRSSAVVQSPPLFLIPSRPLATRYCFSKPNLPLLQRFPVLLLNHRNSRYCFSEPKPSVFCLSN